MDTKKTSKVCMTLTSSTGTWLNGCLQPQLFYVTLTIKDPDGKMATVGLSFEQASRMMLYNGDVECTLLHYRNKEGKMDSEKVEPPVSVKERMHDRLKDVEGSLMKRLEDVTSDLSSMIDGHTKANKSTLTELMRDIHTIQSHLHSNREFVVQETEKELSEMQSNMIGQIGLAIQANTGVELPGEALKNLLPVSDGPLLIGNQVVPILEQYALKDRPSIGIGDMTAREVALAIQNKLRLIERRIPPSSLLSWPSASSTKKERVCIRYVSYQNEWTLELDQAKEYLAYLSEHEITVTEEFLTHFQVLK